MNQNEKKDGLCVCYFKEYAFPEKKNYKGIKFLVLVSYRNEAMLSRAGAAQAKAKTSKLIVYASFFCAYIYTSIYVNL